MKTYEVTPVGRIGNNENGAYIQLNPEFIPALQALDGFSHIYVLWWCSGFDNEVYRSVRETERPYKTGPDQLGIFATRSPIRPNPIALTASGVIGIDHENGVIRLDYTDADDGTPVLDVKPYTPSADRVENPQVPAWCAHWPKSYEESGSFAWQNEFNF